MENKYEVFFNLDDITKDVYKKRFVSEDYEIVADEEGVFFVKKLNNKDINLENEKVIVSVIKSMAKLYSRNVKGVLHIDFTNYVKQKKKKIKDEKVKSFDNRITWQIRQAITKAIVDKK